MTANSDQGYWAPGELETVHACPACGSLSTSYRYQNLLDHSEGVPGQWNFRVCADCDSLFLDPRPTQAAISKAYSSSSYFTHDSGVAAHESDNGESIGWRLANGYLNERFGCRRRPAMSIGKWLIPMIVPIRQQLDFFYRHLPRRSGKLLDIGCGNGAFLLRAAEAGWNIQGIEPDPIAAARAIATGFPIHRGDVTSFTTDEEFDVITLSHVFEHLHEPLAVLLKCRDMLCPGGRLWMAMPNAEGLGHLIYGKAWFPLEPPRHLLLPSRKELRRLCHMAGFSKVIFLRRGRSGFGGVRVSAERASKQIFASGPARLWHGLINMLSVFSPRWSEELIVMASKDSK